MVLAFCWTVSAPSIVPAVVGRNVTATVQLALAARVEPQGLVPLPAAVKSAVVANPRVREPVNWLVTVTVWAALVLPTATVGKVRLAGLTAIG